MDVCIKSKLVSFIRNVIKKENEEKNSSDDCCCHDGSCEC